MIFLLVCVVGALAASFLCSLAEAALLSVTPSQIAAASIKSPRAATFLQRLKDDFERPIAVIIIVNTAAHTIGASLAGARFNELFGDRWLVLYSLTFTFLVLQFSELLPKTLGVRRNARLALWMAGPLSVATRIFSPFIRVAHWINRPFEGKHDPARKHAARLEEITALAGLARLSDVIGSQEERIIRGASRLSQMTAEQIMIPLDHVTFLSTKQTIAEAVIAAHLDPHTRFPVIDADDRDKVLGYVNFKEMIYYMRTNPGDPSFRGILRPVYFVAPDHKAGPLLREFVSGHNHLAIVRNDGGRALGLITLEDIVEELVGEIEDEFDRLPTMCHELAGGTWMVGGGLPIQTLARRLDLTLPDAVGTASAWLVRRMEKTPAVNDVYRWSDPERNIALEFLVRRMRRGKIFEMAVTSRSATLGSNLDVRSN